MARRRVLLGLGCSPVLKAVEFTVTALMVKSYSFNAPTIQGYSFLCWVNVSCDDYLGSAYIERFDLQSATVWYRTSPPNSNDYHDTLCALYVKNGFADYFHLELVNSPTSSSQQTVFNAPTVSGYTFATWVGATSDGYVGAAYISSYYNETVNVSSWDPVVARGKNRRIYALYLKAGKENLLTIDTVSSATTTEKEYNLTTNGISGYTFICWLNSSTDGFVGYPGTRNRLSKTCTVYSKTVQSGSDKNMHCTALYLKK